MSIPQMSFSAAVLVMAITIIRAVAINRMPKKAFLALWTVVVLRLLIPFSIPSPLSIYSLVSSRTEVAEKIAETPVAYILPMTPQTQIENTAMTPFIQLPPESIGQTQRSSNAKNLPLWIMVWATGSVLCVLYFTIAYIRFYKRFQTSVVVKNGFTSAWLEEHKIIRPISVRQSVQITTPLTYGIFRPVILLPETIDWSDEKQLRYILTHEYVHIQRFDAASKMLLTVALCAHWFNPLVWVMYILANRDLELACDETVVRRLGESLKSSYALTLVKLEERKSVFAPYYSSFSKNATEARIRAIMKYKKTSVISTLLAILLIVGMTSAFACGAAERVCEPPSNLKEIVTVSNKENKPQADDLQVHDQWPPVVWDQEWPLSEWDQNLQNVEWNQDMIAQWESLVDTEYIQTWLRNWEQHEQSMQDLLLNWEQHEQSMQDWQLNRELFEQYIEDWRQLEQHIKDYLYTPYD